MDRRKMEYYTDPRDDTNVYNMYDEKDKGLTRHWHRDYEARTRFPYLWPHVTTPVITLSQPGPTPYSSAVGDTSDGTTGDDTTTSTSSRIAELPILDAIFHARPTITTRHLLGDSLARSVPEAYHVHAALFLYLVPLLFFLIERLRIYFQRRRRTLSRPHRQPPQAVVQRAFRTRNLRTLISVIFRANNERWTNTPLRYFKRVQDAWHTPNRPWMKRLVEIGVIPLYIEDGGTEIEGLESMAGTETWLAWLWEPIRRIGLAKRVQVRKRAYFEFLVPNSRKPEERKRFLETIIMAQPRVNEYRRTADHPVERLGYGVTVRYHWKRVNPGEPSSTLYVSSTNRPEGTELPLIVRATRWMKPFLQFMPEEPEEVVKPGFGANAHVLADFIQDWDVDRIPLLRESEVAIVRIESRHFQRVELDAFVYHIAQKTGMKRTWGGAEDGARAFE